MQTTNHTDIWVLTDDRTGNAVQAISLAQKLDMNFEIKYLEYNLFAKLPNCLLGHSSIYITAKTKESLQTTNPPKLIIAAGRRAAGIAAYLKTCYKEVKLIQIMKPDIDTFLFDLIVLPQHDVFEDNSNNIIRTIGSIHNIPARIEKYYKKPTMEHFIGVLIGGNTKEYQFTKSDAEELAILLENATESSGIPSFITFSRRTPDVVKKIFAEKFPWPNIVYDPTISKDDNPYLEILRYSKFLILTCDSVSMCSEAASTGHPLYIYTPEGFTSKKHKYFTQQLIDLGIARAIISDVLPLQEYHYTPLNEVSKVAKAVKELL